MFLGMYKTRFSGKNRVILPKKFRQELTQQKEFILTRGLDGCIWGFSKSDWETQSQKQLELSINTEEGRYIRRYFFSSAEVLELDNQGRFIIPTNLIDYAKIETEVLMIGAGDHFELWNPNSWAI